jgi:hypothetical protein
MLSAIFLTPTNILFITFLFAILLYRYFNRVEKKILFILKKICFKFLFIGIFLFFSTFYTSKYYCNQFTRQRNFKYIEYAIRFNPFNEHALLKRARYAAYANKNWTLAIFYLNKLLTLYPYNINGLMKKAIFEYRAKQYNNALSTIDKLLLIDYKNKKMLDLRDRINQILSLTTKTIDLFIIAGQSNAQGYNNGTLTYPKDIKNLDKNIHFYWTTPEENIPIDRWSTLGIQGDKNYFGPEITFARTLKENGFNPAIFKYTLGSTSITKDWKLPKKNGLYDLMTKELNRAKNLLKKDDYIINTCAFIWIQGESDAENETMANSYYQKLKLILKDFRNNVVKKPLLPIIIGVDEQHPWIKKYPQIIYAQKKLAKEDKYISFISMRGLEKSDITHLTSKGLEQYGKRIFDNYFLLSKR